MLHLFNDGRSGSTDQLPTQGSRTFARPRAQFTIRKAVFGVRTVPKAPAVIGVQEVRTALAAGGWPTRPQRRSEPPPTPHLIQGNDVGNDVGFRCAAAMRVVSQVTADWQEHRHLEQLQRHAALSAQRPPAAAAEARQRVQRPALRCTNIHNCHAIKDPTRAYIGPSKIPEQAQVAGIVHGWQSGATCRNAQQVGMPAAPSPRAALTCGGRQYGTRRSWSWVTTMPI